MHPALCPLQGNAEGGATGAPRKCTRCGLHQPMSFFVSSRQPRKKGKKHSESEAIKLTGTCKVCRGQRNNNRAVDHERAIAAGLKFCELCRMAQSPAHFGAGYKTCNVCRAKSKRSPTKVGVHVQSVIGQTLGGLTGGAQ